MSNSSSNLFVALLDTAVSGLYCLINEKDKRVYVCHSINILDSLKRHIESLKMGGHYCNLLQQDLLKLEYKYLETESDKTSMMIKEEKWKRYYQDLGYSLYKRRTAINFKIKMKIETRGELSYKVLVYLITTNNGNKRIVGIFNTKNEGTEFINKYYNNSIIQDIIYSDNKLTQDYMNSLK